ncbi:MAG: hypothetical protein IT298_07715 [Chloroflexi bacterium]|nr:hypothetical protein [Chloroflexota bacterium]MBV6437741.1 hypothetical protein [Anaerolineae bacterium]MDL1916864.1 hypothetical protein [Anaerolineae bacterium CFX4]OQY82333.1 MAG: hypothetical protein B6D42_09530 [Anaerolineae bacterium UTCFX5]MBW7880454.1 hypothetical protein [Anaerolineae bacterium]
MFGALLLAGLAFGSVNAQDTPSDPTADGVSITVYNQGTALVRDRRTFTLTQGESVLNFTDVAATIDATSVNIKSLTDPDGTRVLEQNYVFDLVDTSALLKRYIDQQIQVTMSDGTMYSGVLLSGAYGDIILREDGGQVVVLHSAEARDVRFPALPDGLITRPTLRWFLESAQGGEQQMELTYLAGGMTWTADYNLVVARDNSSLDATGWVTVTNTSGAAYPNAQLKLVAGDVNRIVEPMMYADGMMETRAMAAPTPTVEQREFFEYQLYEVARRVTLGANETKQVEFIAKTGVPASTFFVYDGSSPFYGYSSPIYDQGYGITGVTTVGTYLSFTTAEDGGLGADLPAGRVRVYQLDTDGAALLIGENTVNHTPQGEDVELYLGNAFDLVGEHKQTSYNQLTRDVVQETYEIRLRNRKDSETVEIRVPERLFRWRNWQILNSSHPYEQLDSSTIEFRVEVPPQGETVITYTVQYAFNQ